MRGGGQGGGVIQLICKSSGKQVNSRIPIPLQSIIVNPSKELVYGELTKSVIINKVLGIDRHSEMAPMLVKSC